MRTVDQEVERIKKVLDGRKVDYYAKARAIVKRINKLAAEIEELELTLAALERLQHDAVQVWL